MPTRAGSKIKFDFHYHAVGQEITDQSQLGIVLYPKGYVPTHVVYSKQLGQPTEPLDIPAGDFLALMREHFTTAPANVFLGREIVTRWGTLDDGAMEAALALRSVEHAVEDVLGDVAAHRTFRSRGRSDRRQALL